MDPQDEMKKFEKMMKDLMDGLFGRGKIEVFTPIMGVKGFDTSDMNDTREPLTEINETKKEIIVTMELPGANKDKIKLNVTPKGIDISTDITRVIESKSGRKSSSMRFEKYMSLPEEVEPKSVKAKYKNGILEVVMKKVDKPKGTKVKIE